MSATAPAAPPAAPAPTAPRALLDAQGITKTFHARSINEVRALQGISLRLAEGEFATIIGGNGAGKSTLLNVLAGVFPPDAGHIILAGQDITRLSEHSRAAVIGRVFQNPFAGTAPHLTVAQNLAMALRRGQPRRLGRGVTDARRTLFRDHLATLGLKLEDRLDSRVGLLSGGQRQALTLLMATLVKPALLLLDEHTAALDPATANTVIDLTVRLVSEHRLTTLMVTHNMALALGVGTRTLMMHQGEVILDLAGPERAAMTVRGLVDKFFALRGEEVMSDRLLLY
jgi:putative ABC transport system ATP-binding protein